MKLSWNDVTPEPLVLNRRAVIAGLGLAAAGPALPARAAVDPGKPNSFEEITNYNNFYEFGFGKTDPAENAGALTTDPWAVEIGGMVDRPGSYSLADIAPANAVEDRIYRLRCVEGWSMVIPWSGVPLASVLRKFEPTSKAKYVAFTTRADREQMPGLRFRSINWPYREGLRIDEAMHPLAFLATGLYGKPLPQQNGAPLRLVVPWKYGFKSIKSIVEIRFVERMPATAWNQLQPSEYGFFSNVNPAVDHPRWSQKTERRIAGTSNRLIANRIDTQPFNGYADQVASLYAGMDLRRWY